MSHNRQWFTFKNEAGKTPELFIFDDIDDWYGISAQSIIDQVRDLDATDINVRINSRGGMVFEGIAIYNILRLHKANIHVSIEGLAASIASVIAMAGDTITMAENSMMMIHNPYGWATGDAESMRKTADVMDKIADSIAVSYTARTGKTVDEMKALMEAETWFTAAEALETGLVDQVDTPIQAAACFDLSGFKNTPEGWAGRKQPKPSKAKAEDEDQPDDTGGDKPDAVAIADLCNRSGYPQKTAAFLKGGLTEEVAKAKLTLFDEIKNLCTTAKAADKADEFINKDSTLNEVREALFAHLTKDDSPIDNSIDPNNNGIKESPVIDTQAIYSKRNRA